MAPRATFPSPPPRLDAEATFEALQRLGTTVEDTRLLAGELDYRTDVLEGVQAYGSAVMSKNQWILNGNYLPFDIQIGAPKGVTPFALGDGAGYILHSAGLWRVDGYVLVGTHEFGRNGPNWCDLDIVVLRPDGSEYARRKFFTVMPENEERTLGGSHSFVVPGPGYRVILWGNTGRWRKYIGGALFSSFAVTKYGTEVAAAPPQQVPDSPAPPG